jgi:hypothetical protein
MEDAAVLSTDWTPEIGDPTVGAWIIVAGYILAAVLCAFISKQQQLITKSCLSSQERFFWFGLAVVMLLLGINKQLDFQNLFKQIARNFAKEKGWYESRHTFQLWFFIGTTATGMLFVLFFIKRLRLYWRRYRILFIGILFLCTFFISRFMDFNHVIPQHYWFHYYAGVNWLLEVGGVTFICASAILRIRNYSL